MQTQDDKRILVEPAIFRAMQSMLAAVAAQRGGELRVSKVGLPDPEEEFELRLDPATNEYVVTCHPLRAEMVPPVKVTLCVQVNRGTGTAVESAEIDVVALEETPGVEIHAFRQLAD